MATISDELLATMIRGLESHGGAKLATIYIANYLNALRDLQSLRSQAGVSEAVAFDGLSKRKLGHLTDQGYKINGYAVERDGNQGFITTGGFVGWWRPAPIEITEEMVERACPAVCEDTSFGVDWADLLWCIEQEQDAIKRMIFEQKRDRVRRIARAALTAALQGETK